MPHYDISYIHAQINIISGGQWNIANKVEQAGYKVNSYPCCYFMSHLLYFVGNVSLSTQDNMDLSMDVGDIIMWHTMIEKR